MEQKKQNPEITAIQEKLKTTLNELTEFGVKQEEIIELVKSLLQGSETQRKTETLAAEEMLGLMAVFYKTYKKISVQLDQIFIPYESGDNNLLQQLMLIPEKADRNAWIDVLRAFYTKFPGSVSIGPVRTKKVDQIAIFPERIWGSGSKSLQEGLEFKNLVDRLP